MAEGYGGFRPGPGGARVTFNVTSPTAIKANPGTIFRVYVNTAPSAPGGVYDANTSAGATAATLIAPVPTTAGPFEVIAPCYTGIWVDPGTGGVVSVSWD